MSFAHQRAILDIAYYTGERWGAILQLHVADVFDGFGKPRPVIVFRRNTTKTRETREVPVHPDLAVALGGLVVGGLEQPLFSVGISAADKYFRRAIAKAGLSHLGYSTYSTRRGFITQLSRKGISVRVIQKLTGHKSLANLQRYIEVSEGELVSALKTVGH
jgi:integrase/recombinase XerD